jgi:hypothetical protein
VFGLIVLIALIVAWVLPYRQLFYVSRYFGDHVVTVATCYGRFEASVYQLGFSGPNPTGWQAKVIGVERAPTLPSFALDRPSQGPMRLKFAMPCWFLVLLFGTLEVFLIQGRWRFSMRAILLATTLAALAFGAISLGLRNDG